MREENLSRLNSTNVKLSNPYYLSYKFLFTDLKKAIDLYAKGDILDIGCGNKPYLHYFDNKNSSYIGCDIIQSNANRVDIICPATEIPLPDRSKHTVFTTQVIEHVADHRKLLSEAFRILKPGGYLILSGPMAWEHHEVPYDFFRFTKYGFEWLLKEQGFDEIQVVPNGGKWAMVGQLTLNSIRSSFKKKSVARKILSFLFFVLRIKWLINITFLFLEKIDKDYSATLNFVVVARKSE